MTISSELLFGGIVGIIALVIAVVTMLRTPRRFQSREEWLSDEVTRLDATVQSLLRRATTDQSRITELERALAEAKTRITELEHELAFHRREIVKAQPKPTKRQPVKKLLIIGGPHEDFLALDEHFIQGIGIPYTRLRNASAADIRNDFARVRADDRLYPWVLISGEREIGGTEQRGGIMSDDEWMRELDGVSVIALATCDAADLADHLKQRGRFVWYFRERVPSDLASLFVKAFFQRLNGGELPLDAFTYATASVPEVAAYAEYRQ